MPGVASSTTPLELLDRYRLLIDSVTDYAIYMLDASGTVVSWNAGARRFKGYEEAEILGQHFSRFYTAEDRSAGMPQRTLEQAAAGRFEGEGWRVRKDGSRFWCHVVVDPMRAPDGSLIGFAKITRDLTERKLAEESLKQSEQQFRLLVQSVTDYAIYMLDPTGIITNWNAGAQRIKGYRPDEVIGQHYSMFFTEEDRQRGAPQRGLAAALRDGRFESQGWRVRKDGSRFWANVVVDPIRSESGVLLGFAKVTRDITESVEAQRALEKAREALFQSQKMESLGRLTGGIAHDFNNLLMAVLGGLELVRRRVDGDPRLVPLLDNAIQGAERGVSLSQRMLAFARRQELHLELVDVPALVRGMADLLRQSLGPRIAVETRFPTAARSPSRPTSAGWTVVKGRSRQVNTSAWRWPTKARAWTRRHWTRRPNPSLPPRASARALVSGSPWFMAWRRSPAAGWCSRARRAPAPPLSSGCRWPPRPRQRRIRNGRCRALPSAPWPSACWR